MTYETQVFPVHNVRRDILTVTSDAPVAWQPGQEIIEPRDGHEIHYEIGGVVRRHEQGGKHIAMFLYHNKYTVLDGESGTVAALKSEVSELREENQALQAKVEETQEALSTAETAIQLAVQRGAITGDQYGELLGAGGTGGSGFTVADNNLQEAQ